MWKMIVRTDIKEIYEKRERVIEAAFRQNFLFGKNTALFLF